MKAANHGFLLALSVVLAGCVSPQRSQAQETCFQYDADRLLGESAVWNGRHVRFLETQDQKRFIASLHPSGPDQKEDFDFLLGSFAAPDRAIVTLRPGVDPAVVEDRFGVELEKLPLPRTFLAVQSKNSPDASGEPVDTRFLPSDLQLDPVHFAGASESPSYSAGSERYFTSVEPDYLVKLEHDTPKQPSDYPSSAAGGQFRWHFESIKAPLAWAHHTGSYRVRIAVVDSGLAYDDPDFQPNAYQNPSEVNGTAGVDDDGNGYLDDDRGWDTVKNDGKPLDLYRHGTQVSTHVGAVGDNGTTGLVGLNWRATIVPIRAFDKGGCGSVSKVIAALDYAIATQAHVVLAAWTLKADSGNLRSKFEDLKDAGILVVAAAGNEGKNMDCNHPYYPAAWRLDNVISVMGVGIGGSSYGNYGASAIHLAAPGEAIRSLIPRAMAVGVGYTKTESGSSFAAAFVAGAAALAKAKYPTATYRQIKNRILSTVSWRRNLVGKSCSAGALDLHRMLTAPDDELIFPPLCDFKPREPAYAVELGTIKGCEELP